MSTPTIAGFSSSTKSPGFFAEVIYGAGPASFGDVPLYLLLIGSASSTGGSAAPDVDIVDITSADVADASWGAGGELPQMAYTGLLYPGVRMKGIAIAPAGSSVAASATITIAGTWTVAGTYRIRIGGTSIDVTISASMTVTQAAAAIAAAVNARPRFPFSATSALGVVTLTCKSVGVRGNAWALYHDTSAVQAGLTATLAGGASLSRGGVRFTGGVGQDDITNVLAAINTGFYDTIAVATTSAAGVTDPNPARVKAALMSRAAVGVQNYSHVCYGHNGAYADAQTLAKTSLNDQVAEVFSLPVSEAHPCQLAASGAAMRQQLEQVTPNNNFNGRKLLGVPGLASLGDNLTAAAVEIALNNGVTACTSNAGGDVLVSRAITTHCLTAAGAADYSTIDVGQAKTPQRFEQVMQLFWESTYVVANPFMSDDPGPNDEPALAGVATPSGWNAEVVRLLREAEKALWITAVNDNLPTSGFNGAIMSVVPVKTLRINNNTGISLRQVG